MKLILTYTAVAALISALTAPIPGTSLLLTGLEVYMIVHLAKVHDYNLGLKGIGYSAVTLWALSTVLKDAALEILTFFPPIGWAAEVVVTIVFVSFLGFLVNLYFSKSTKSRG